jgi:hypothetical protein
MAGYRDVTQNLERNIQTHNEYSKADRAFSKSYGTLEDYRDGYQQGFESGYSTGFEKRDFDSTLPVEIKKRGTTTPAITAPVLSNNSGAATTPTDNINSTAANTEIMSPSTPTNTTPTADTVAQAPIPAMLDGQIIIIPKDTELIVELLGTVTTSANSAGDKFQAKVVSPYELSGAIIDGRVDKVTKPGRIKKRAELQLSFGQIHLNNERWSNLNAILTEVLPVKGDNVKKVDNEGSAVGKSSIKPDAAKVGAATGTGLVIGAIVAGPVGAGVGAAMGAAFGVGAVVVERGKHIKLTQGQQLRVRTVYETQIR